VHANAIRRGESLGKQQVKQVRKSEVYPPSAAPEATRGQGL